MRTSLNVPDDVLDAFDETWSAEGIESRSRAVRTAMQEYVERHASLEAASGEVVALLSFDYEHPEVIEDLHDVQHEFQDVNESEALVSRPEAYASGDVVQTTSHVHQGDWCLEAVFCRGPANRVRELAFRLRDFDAVGRVRPMLLHPERQPRPNA